MRTSPAAPNYNARHYNARRAVAALCLLTVILGSPRAARPQDSSPDQPYAIVTEPNVDENLFAIRVLAYIYANWPDSKKSRKELSAWLTNTRAFASGMRGQIRARGLDPSLDMAYQGCLDSLAATEAYLAAINEIDSQANTQSTIDAFTSLWTAFSKGSDVQSTAEKVMSKENASNTGAVAGALTGLFDYAQRSTARTNTSRAAIAEQQRKLENTWNTGWAATQGVANILTEKFRWAPGEAGFDGYQGARMSDFLQRYPRDPFIKAKYAESLAAGNDPAQLQQAAYSSLQATELVPANRSYDSFRSQFLSDAVYYSAEAASLQAGLNGYSARPAMAGYASKIARTYLSLFPNDKDRWGDVQLARALAFSGRFAEALEHSTAAYNSDRSWANDASFCTRYAALLSLNNQSTLVGDWLAQSFKDGFTNIPYIRTSPDFSNFRVTQAPLYSSLTKVHWGWQIDYGLLNDDLIVKNTSAFDLTNVTVHLHIRKGEQVWNRQMKCETIRAGDTCKSVDIISIPGDTYDEGTASLTSDQSANQ